MSTIRRHSVRAERSKPAAQSPFRSAEPSRRMVEALRMIALRQDEVARIERALLVATDKKVQRKLTTRLLATKNNLASWEAYYFGENEKQERCYREPRAVIIPTLT